MSPALALSAGDALTPPAPVVRFRQGPVVQILWTPFCILPVALTPREGTVTTYGEPWSQMAMRLCQSVGRRPGGLTIRALKKGDAGLFPCGEPGERNAPLAIVDSPDADVRALLPAELNSCLRALTQAGWRPMVERPH